MAPKSLYLCSLPFLSYTTTRAEPSHLPCATASVRLLTSTVSDPKGYTYYRIKNGRILILTVKASNGGSHRNVFTGWLLGNELSQPQTQIAVSINSYIYLAKATNRSKKKQGEGHPILLHRHLRSRLVKKEITPNITALFLPQKQI